MATVCYAWDDTPFKWNEAPFTWKEGCVIEKILDRVGGVNKEVLKRRVKKVELTDDEKKTLIELFIRLEIDEIVFEKRVNKQKNQKVKIKLRDVEISSREQKKVKVDVKIDNI